jgi:hypothetical protein
VSLATWTWVYKTVSQNTVSQGSGDVPKESAPSGWREWLASCRALGFWELRELLAPEALAPGPDECMVPREHSLGIRISIAGGQRTHRSIPMWRESDLGGWLAPMSNDGGRRRTEFLSLVNERKGRLYGEASYPSLIKDEIGSESPSADLGGVSISRRAKS